MPSLGFLLFKLEVVGVDTLSPDRLHATLEPTLELDRNGWLSFRALGENRNQAHTSPVFVELTGKDGSSNTMLSTSTDGVIGSRQSWKSATGFTARR